jgi:GNAT superfamily N-acetyltransferase
MIFYAQNGKTREMKISKSSKVKSITLNEKSKFNFQLIDDNCLEQTVKYFFKVITQISIENGFGPGFDYEEVYDNNVVLLMPYYLNKIIGECILTKKYSQMFIFNVNGPLNEKEVKIIKNVWAIRSIQIIKKYQRKGIAKDLVRYIITVLNENKLKYPVISTSLTEEGVLLFTQFIKCYRVIE